LDFKNTGEVLEFYKNTPPQDLKALTGFVQTFGIDKIIYQLESNKNTIVKYTRFLPEINELLQLVKVRNDYITKNREVLYDIIYGGPVPAELKEINNNIRTVNKKLREKVKALLDTLNKLKKQGLIEPARLNIKKDSWRFKAAGELAGELASLWFVSKVTLVGSVAKGTSTAQSDIDLLVDIVLRKVSAYLDRLVKRKIESLEEKYRPYMKKQSHKIFHCVRAA